MLEFSDIFAYGITTSVYFAGSIMMIATLLTSALWFTSAPVDAHTLDLAPAFGL